MTSKEHAQLLSGFLTTLFDKDDTVHIFPSLSEAKFKDVIAGKASFPNEKIHGKQLTYFPRTRDDDGCQWDQDIISSIITNQSTTPIPRKVLNPFSRRPGSTRTDLIEKLNDFVALGYDIYFCVNPLNFGHRSQRTVRKARHIVLESDNPATPIETQKEIFDKYKDSISAMVFSGNRSVHAFVRLTDPIRNVYPITWRSRHRLRMNVEEKEEEPDWKTYKEVATYWIRKMEVEGLKIDTSVATDCSRLTRLPGFDHSKSGKPSEMLFLNPSSKFDWYWETQLAYMCECEYDDERLGNRFIHVQNSPGNYSLMGSMVPMGPMVSMPSIVPDSNSIGIDGNGCIPSYSIVAMESSNIKLSSTVTSDGNGLQTLETLEERGKRRKRTRETNVIRFATFLDDLRGYEALKQGGIPKRHVRRTLHKVMFSATRVLGMTNDQAADEWREILGKHPENIGCSIEEAVQELLALFRFRATTRLVPFLPNTQKLPDCDDHRGQLLKQWLVSKGCPCATDVLKIIRSILWGCIRDLPLQCVQGKIGLKSAVLQRICRGKGGYKQALAWLEDRHIVRMTNEKYCPGERTRKYFVNIPLILYCAGFQTAELDWSQCSKKGAGAYQAQDFREAG